MALITWSDNYSVNINEIDKQHQKLVGLVNSLHDGMKVGKGKELLGGILNELVNYTAFHFGCEEKLFDQYLYPETKTHKREHSDLVEQVMTYKKSYESGNSILSMEIMNFLKDWLTNHIVGSDKKYSTFLNSKGIR